MLGTYSMITRWKNVPTRSLVMQDFVNSKQTSESRVLRMSSLVVGAVWESCVSRAAELFIAEIKTDNQKCIHRKLAL
jgi:hypothetical protein